MPSFLLSVLAAGGARPMTEREQFLEDLLAWSAQEALPAAYEYTVGPILNPAVAAVREAREGRTTPLSYREILGLAVPAAISIGTGAGLKAAVPPISRGISRLFPQSLMRIVGNPEYVRFTDPHSVGLFSSKEAMSRAPLMEKTVRRTMKEDPTKGLLRGERIGKGALPRSAERAAGWTVSDIEGAALPPAAALDRSFWYSLFGGKPLGVAKAGRIPVIGRAPFPAKPGPGTAAMRQIFGRIKPEEHLLPGSTWIPGPPPKTELGLIGAGFSRHFQTPEFSEALGLQALRRASAWGNWATLAGLPAERLLESRPSAPYGAMDYDE